MAASNFSWTANYLRVSETAGFRKYLFLSFLAVGSDAGALFCHAVKGGGSLPKNYI